MPKGFKKDGTKLGFQKGRIAWNKGLPPWNKGKHPKYVQGKNNPMFGISRAGKINPNWRGGEWIEKDKGYILIYCPYHPNKIYQRYVYEHRLKIEKKIGRFLKSSEIVHHINGNPSDNRITNLKLCKNNAEHRR